MKGFFSVILLLAMLLLLVHGMSLHAKTWSALDDARNAIMIRQKIAETVYEIENGFALAVKKGLRKIKDYTTQKRATEIVCKEIVEWAMMLTDHKAYVGFIDPTNDFKKVNVKRLTASTCIDFLLVEHGIEARVVSSIKSSQFRAAFLFEVDTYAGKVKVLIPEGTKVIK